MSFAYVKPASNEGREISIQTFGVASTSKETIKRIDQFLEEFLKMEDMFETKIDIGGSMTDVFLEYIVLAPEEINIDWKNLLNKKKEDKMNEIRMLKEQNESDEKIKFL